MVAPLFGAGTDSAKAAFSAALGKALTTEAKLSLVDQAALKATLDEAALAGGASDAVLADIGGAFGAEAVVTGEVSELSGGHVVNLRITAIADGTILAATKLDFDADGAAPTAEAKTLETQLRRLADRLADGLGKIEGDLRYQYVAVLPFEEIGERTKDKQLGLLVSAELTTLLRRDHGLLLVERSRLSALVDEMALGQTGLVDPSKVAEVGKLAGAQALVIGSVAEAGDQYLTNARIVSVADGQVKIAEEVRLPAADLVALSSEAVVLRTRGGAVYRSILLPGWGQLYNREPVKGGIFAAVEAASVGLAVTFHLLYDQADSRYQKMQSGDFDEAVALRDNRLLWRNVFLWATLAVHLVNVADALIFGRSFDSAEPTAAGVSGMLPFQW
jgi:TolB-like protein